MLEKCKGSFRVAGIIRGKDNPSNNNGYKEGEFTDKNGKVRKYRSIRFLVQTSPTNIIPVELFGSERDTAVLYNRQTKVSKKVAWGIRHNKPDEGYSLIIPEYDLVKIIHESFHDGDSVVVIGEPQFSQYVNKNGDTVPQTRYIIRQMYKATNDIDFNSPNFKENNSFSQDIIVDTMEIDGDKLYIHAYITDPYKSTVATTMVIEATKDQAFARNMLELQSGDKIRVNGIIRNEQIVENIQVDDGWGTKEKVATRIYRAMEVTGANPDTLEHNKYTLDDLFGVKESQDNNSDWLFSDENTLPF
jgi:hypothetical protein